MPNTDGQDFHSIHARLAGLRDKQFFFIGGAPKSGTTWLQMLLNAHPDISCNGEGHLANHLAPHLANLLNMQNTLVNKKNQSIFNEIGGYAGFGNHDYAYLLGAAVRLAMLAQPNAAHARALGEKTPDNVLHFAMLQTLFPQARFLHMVRDGRDCAVSSWFHRQRIDPAELHQQFGSQDQFLLRAAESWAAVVQAGHGFASANPDTCLTVRYRDLIDDPAGQLDQLFRFLKVRSTPAIARQCADAASFSKLSGRAPGEENRQSFFRRGEADDWRRHMTDAVDQQFRQVAGRWLTEYRFI